MLVLALRLRQGRNARIQAADRLFALSICYLLLLFAALLLMAKVVIS